MITLIDIFLIIVVSVITVAAVLVFVRFGYSTSVTATQAKEQRYGDISFQFLGKQCEAASQSALELLGKDSPKDVQYAAVCDTLSLRFDSLKALLDDQGKVGVLEEILSSSVSNDMAQLHLSVDGENCLFRVADPVIPSAVDRHKAMTNKTHRKQMYASLNKVPHPVWITGAGGQLEWANQTYSALSPAGAELATVFEFDSLRAMHGQGDRVSFTSTQTGDETHWFDITMIEIDQGRFLLYAINVDGLIAAETAQRKFVQTLAKTFAQLSIGLAIFDRDRKLVLFNPALVDLSALPAQFLSAQPNLQSFFDKLRENRIMPEPKDYATWRRQIADLVVKSSGGDYQETWGLPSGLTYRVTGRPHPDGAIAILIEDITAEISLTRRFKGQIELANTALETLSDAIIVFCTDDSVAFWNTAFKEFFDLPKEALVADHSMQEVLKHCATTFSASSELDGFKRALNNPREVRTIKGTLPLSKGPDLPFEMRTHDGTATIITFKTSAQPTRKAFQELTSVN